MNALHRPHAVPPQAERLILVISDMEMGSGGLLDDFPHDDWFADLLATYDGPAHAHLDIDLVFNGDTFDFLKTPYRGEYLRHITRDVALGKLLAIAAAHPVFFEALRRFLSVRPGHRRIWFITGNHDYELLFPEVQAAVRALVGPPERCRFPGFALDLGDVHMEHGHQEDRLFRMDEDMLFVDHRGDRILNLPWGAVALLDVILPLHPLLYHQDRLKPRGRVLELLPELGELMTARYWRYYTRDYVRGWLTRSDPVKRVRWSMFREVMTRFGSRDISVHVGDKYIKSIHEDAGPRVVLIGHLHEAQWMSSGDRKLLVTGAMRNEFMVTRDGLELSRMPKVYAEVYTEGGHAVRSHLVEVDGPPPPEGYVPNVFDVREHLLELLGQEPEPDEAVAAAEAAEREEAPEPAE